MSVDGVSISRLRDLCESVDYGYTASASAEALGAHFLRITDIVSSSIDWRTVPYVASDDRIVDKYRLCDGDIVIARTGASTGASAYITDPPEAVFASYLVRLKVKPEYDPRYVFYCLRAPAFLSYLHGVLGDKSAQPNASASTLTAAPLPVLTDIAEQRSASRILGALDDKIELNRKMSATLEAIARALFKSWFVDFDPVRAKAEGRDPGLPADIAVLFPDSFEETDHGQIPSGWRVDSLKNAIRILDSKRIPLSGRERAARTGPYPYYGAASVMDYIDDFIFSGVHLLIGEDGSVVRDDGTPVLQYIWGEFWVNNHAHVIVGDGAVSTEQIYMFLQQTNIQPYVTGAVQLKLNQGNLFRIPFLRSPDSILSCFAEIVSPLFERIRLSSDESRTLAALRDAVLPKLISGELRVGEAERVLAASA